MAEVKKQSEKAPEKVAEKKSEDNNAFVKKQMMISLKVTTGNAALSAGYFYGKDEKNDLLVISKQYNEMCNDGELWLCEVIKYDTINKTKVTWVKPVRLQLHFYKSKAGRIIATRPNNKHCLLEYACVEQGCPVKENQDWLCEVVRVLEHKDIVRPIKLVLTEQDNMAEMAKKLELLKNHPNSCFKIQA